MADCFERLLITIFIF